MTEYFKPIDHDVNIPYINAEGEVAYNKVSKELFNEAVLKGYMSD